MERLKTRIPHKTASLLYRIVSETDGSYLAIQDKVRSSRTLHPLTFARAVHGFSSSLSLVHVTTALPILGSQLKLPLHFRNLRSTSHICQDQSVHRRQHTLHTRHHLGEGGKSTAVKLQLFQPRFDLTKMGVVCEWWQPWRRSIIRKSKTLPRASLGPMSSGGLKPYVKGLTSIFQVGLGVTTDTFNELEVVFVHRIDTVEDRKSVV